MVAYSCCIVSLPRAFLQSRQYSDSTLQAVQDFDDSQVDIDLLFALVEHIVLRMPEGAVLCFLPGWDDISKLHERLIKAHTFRDTSRFVIIPLHSMMPTVNQKTVFDRPPPGTRKIILSTNIAETSITIDDIVYVVDSGYVKEKDYDFINDIDSLRALPISRASARQRKGRAGRVQPGVRLFLDGICSVIIASCLLGKTYSPVLPIPST